MALDIAGLLPCYCRVMIPYDDLVAALTTWRARQGLPVVRTGAATPAPAPAPAQRVVAVPAAAPAARTAPINAPQRAMPLPAPLESGLDDFDDGALIEEGSYDSGEDYVLSLGDAGPGPGPGNEVTAIGGAPEAPGSRRGGGGGKRGNDW
jgi:hypothetical protein